MVVVMVQPMELNEWSVSDAIIRGEGLSDLDCRAGGVIELARMVEKAETNRENKNIRKSVMRVIAKLERGSKAKCRRTAENPFLRSSMPILVKSLTRTVPGKS